MFQEYYPGSGERLEGAYRSRLSRVKTVYFFKKETVWEKEFNKKKAFHKRKKKDWRHLRRKGYNSIGSGRGTCAGPKARAISLRRFFHSVADGRSTPHMQISSPHIHLPLF